MSTINSLTKEEKRLIKETVKEADKMYKYELTVDDDGIKYYKSHPHVVKFELILGKDGRFEGDSTFLSVWELDKKYFIHMAFSDTKIITKKLVDEIFSNVIDENSEGDKILSLEKMGISYDNFLNKFDKHYINS